MRRLRISAISYLNTAPLMWDFERGHLAQHFDISYTVPSLCAQALAKDEADIGIIPAIAYQTIPALVVIPEIAIAARGPVRSILLVSKVPVEKINSVAVDTSSRTSVALLEILFRKGWLTPRSTQPKISPQAPNLKTMLATNEAALLIGYPALTVDRANYQTIDLAEVWFRNSTDLIFHDPLAAAVVFDESLCTFEQGNIAGDIGPVGDHVDLQVRRLRWLVVLRDHRSQSHQHAVGARAQRIEHRVVVAIAERHERVYLRVIGGRTA